MNDSWVLLLLWLFWPLGAATSILSLRRSLKKSPTALPRAGARGFSFGVASSALLSLALLTFGSSLSLTLIGLVMGVGAAFLAVASAFLVRTSIRIQELRKAGEEGTKTKIIASRTISATDDFEVRLRRLLDSGYLERKRDVIYAPKSAALFYARLVRRLRSVVLQRDY